MAELGGTQNAQNDHAIRDQIVTLPWLGKITVGPSGFRFVRIDAVDPQHPARLSQVRAVLQIRDIPYVGSFQCNDERLNRIWQVGAYTVHLNMQDYLWDGIKRDRLVWIGDMHPEVSTINAVFGFNDVVPRSLDLTRDVTPVTEWMNGISSYSMWWVLIHEEMWMHHGNREYLAAQQSYLTALLRRLANLIGPDGKERIDGMRFLDWPSSPNQQGVTAGLQGLLVMTLESGARLMTALGDAETAKLCADAASRGRKVVPDVNKSKSGAALLSLAGMMDARRNLRPGAQDRRTERCFHVLRLLRLAGTRQIGRCLHGARFHPHLLGCHARPGRHDVLGRFQPGVDRQCRPDRRAGAARQEGHPRRFRRVLLRRLSPQLLPRLGQRPDRLAQPERVGRQAA